MTENELSSIYKPPRTAPTSSDLRAPPLLVLLHGTGANEKDLLSVAEMFDQRFAICSLRAPLNFCGGYRWFEGMSSAPEQTALQSTIAQSSNKTYTSLLSKWPRAGLIAGAVICSGRLFPHLFDPLEPLHSRLAPSQQLDKVPVLVTHGIHDPVTPVTLGRESQKLAEHGMPLATLEYTEYPGMHSVMGVEQIASWFNSKLDL
mmetsp:Transcript_31138/g.43156  ORF Transcript_31138/g.43156 Transcript_31138/m.43156 type:complete len:203 (+) Transcript_31138:2-610(+)